MERRVEVRLFEPLPSGLALTSAGEEVLAAAERMERERPRILSFALSPQQAEIVEAAIDRALEQVAGTSRGAALTFIAQEHMDRADGGGP